MREIWLVLQRFLGYYIASAVLFIVPLGLLWLGFWYVFRIEKAMTNQEIIAFAHIPDSILYNVLEAECNIWIDGQGCYFVLKFSKKDREFVHECILKDQLSTTSLSTWKHNTYNGIDYFESKVYKISPNPVDISFNWNPTNGELKYQDSNGQMTTAGLLYGYFKLIQFMPVDLGNVTKGDAYSDTSHYVLSENDNRRFSVQFNQNKDWKSVNEYEFHKSIIGKNKSKKTFKLSVFYNRKLGALNFVRNRF